MTVWQVAAGSLGRNYTDRFIRHGIAFVGGDAFCRTMSEQVQLGDKVILKRGMGQIVAAGEVVERAGQFKGNGNKDWLQDFDGWDLSAWCYVDWHVPDTPVQINGLTRTTIQRVAQSHLLAEVDRILSNVPRRTNYDPEPPSTQPVGDDALISRLIELGLRPGAAEELTQALRRIRLLAKFYLGRNWDLTNEHDARTFLVVPLLLALGWAEQRMNVEMVVPGVGRADIGCFGKPIRGADDQCVLLIETKSLSQGLDYAPDQAHQYAAGLPACGVVLVTNGYCYKAYERTGDTFSTRPSAYLNLMNPRNRYPLDPVNVGGALKVLELLLPGG
jgi:hypothetical protein